MHLDMGLTCRASHHDAAFWFSAFLMLRADAVEGASEPTVLASVRAFLARAVSFKRSPSLPKAVEGNGDASVLSRCLSLSLPLLCAGLLCFPLLCSLFPAPRSSALLCSPPPYSPLLCSTLRSASTDGTVSGSAKDVMTRMAENFEGSCSGCFFCSSFSISSISHHFSG
jgi:hypothetical protein